MPTHPTDVSEIYIAAPDSIWISGTTVMHWDGEGWAPVGLKTSDPTRTIWGFGDNDVWVGGDSLLHWDGFEWTTIAVPFNGFRSIHGTRPDDVWVSTGQSVLRWNGSAWGSWLVQPALFNTLLPAGVFSFSPHETWAGPFHFNGTGWVVHQPMPITNYGPDQLWGSAPDDVWGTVTSTGGIWHWDGGVWSEVAGMAVPFDVSGSAADDVWIAARDVLHFDGTQLTSVEYRPDPFTTVSVLERGRPVFASRDEVVRYELDGGITVLSENGLVTDMAWSATDGWAVGNRFILRYDGSFWRPAAPPPGNGRLNAVAFSGARAWVGGREANGTFGELHTWDGTAWSFESLGSAVDAIWAGSPTDVWVFCRDEFRHWDGVMWTSTPHVGTPRWPVVEAWSDGTMMIALTTGSLLTWAGGVWNEDVLSPGGTLRSLSVRSPTDLWVVGDSIVLHGNGSSWHQVSYQSTERLTGVVATGARKAWVFMQTGVWAVDLASPGLSMVNTDLVGAQFQHVEHSGTEFRVITSDSIFRAP